ncbi:hypothetical protein N0V88_001782 [Collariella sp. IMI 366227]|nr:hypothetical protein N0V88_001782 [Collariella sp. IMI 366227]
MDDAASLVSELHHKLAELDGKVAAYQRDMLAEFHKHMEDCLKNYPGHFSSEVSQVITESILLGRVPKDGPRSPHAREIEFQGLFTPTYLPLLESKDLFLPARPMPTPPTPVGPPLPLSTDNVKKVEEAKEAAPLASSQARPAPIRRLTDGSTSSVASSGSDSKVRRSALRRSSSNKGSPRRVRFDFDGEEVFPAGSPPPRPSPVVAIPETPKIGAESQSPQAEAPAIATDPDESTAYGGTSLLDIEGEEDWVPRPKKVSSTQALQALTRSPLEEGTTWTVVNADFEEPAKMNGEKQFKSGQGTLGDKVDSQATIRADDREDQPGNGDLGSPIEELTKYDDEDENASDEEFLAMRPKKKTPSPPAQNPFAHPSPQRLTSNPKPPHPSPTARNPHRR